MASPILSETPTLSCDTDTVRLVSSIFVIDEISALGMLGWRLLIQRHLDGAQFNR